VNVELQLKGLAGGQVDAEVCEMLNDLGLNDKRDARVKTLSGGMKRKLSVGIALVGGSKVVDHFLQSFSKTVCSSFDS